MHLHYTYKMQRPVFYQIQDKQLELLNLQIECQRMQNQVLAELMVKRIPQNEAIIKYNILATQWIQQTKPVEPPSSMYS